ncbi:MAG: DUF2851 family protein, partial [FCB group bacterium]|nr:DUF2851 family protein [FCB group bacterium]
MQFPLPDQGVYFLRDSGPIRESRLVEEWLRLPVGTELVTLDGSPVIILQTGHRNRNAGPDIFQAQVYIAGTFSVGAVEFHVRAGDWYVHGHQNDTRYNNVILHVVTRVGRRYPDLPTIILSSASYRRSCPVSPRSPHWDVQLRAFGSRRWVELKTFFQENPGPEYLWLWQRCLHILGQGGNEDHFAALSRRLAWEEAAACHSVETLIKQVARLKIPWKHCSIRPAAWPERRIPLLHVIATLIGRLPGKHGQLSPVELRSDWVIPGAPSLSIELLGNCWYPW